MSLPAADPGGPRPLHVADGDEFLGGEPRRWREEHWAHFVVTRAGETVLAASCGLRVDVRRRPATSATRAPRPPPEGMAAAWCGCSRSGPSTGSASPPGAPRRRRNVGSRRTSPPPAFAAKAWSTAPSWRAASTSTTCCSGSSPATRAPAPGRRHHGRGSPARRRPPGGPALGAGRRRCRPRRLRRPRRGALDLRPPGPVLGGRRRAVRRRRLAPAPAGERAWLAMASAPAASSSAASASTCTRTARPANRLLGDDGGAPPGRSPRGGAPRRPLGLQRGRR